MAKQLKIRDLTLRDGQQSVEFIDAGTLKVDHDDDADGDGDYKYTFEYDFTSSANSHTSGLTGE